MKKIVLEKCQKMFLEAIFFSQMRELFSKLQYKIFGIALHDIGLQNFSFSF